MRKEWLMVSILVMILGISVFSKITLWISWEGEEWFREEAKAFKKEFGIDVDVVYIPNVWSKLFMTLKGKGDLPDVCLIKNENLETIEGYVNLPSLKEIGLNDEDFNGKMLKAFRVKGTVRAVPFYADVQIMYLNIDLFEKLDLELPEKSWNFDGFIDLLRNIKRKGFTPTAMGLFSPYFFFGLQAGLGSGLGEGKIRVDTAENIRLIELLKKLYDEGLIMNITKKRPIMVKKFIKDELALLPHGSFLIRKFKEKKVNFSITILPKPWKGIVDPKGFIVFRNDEDVRKFLKFMLKDSGEFMEKYIKIPALKHQNLKNEYFPILMEAFENGILQPSTIEYERYWEIMGDALELSLTGKIKIADALKKAQSYIEGGR